MENNELLNICKDEVALSFTDGRHKWRDGYLNNSMRHLLLNDVAKKFATRYNEVLQQKHKAALDLIEELENKCEDLQIMHEAKVMGIKNQYSEEDIKNAYIKGASGGTYFLNDGSCILPATYEGVDG